MRLVILVFIILTFFNYHTRAIELVEMEDVKKVHEEYLCSIKDIVDAYKQVLNKEEEKSISEGNLENVEDIEKEKDNISKLDLFPQETNWEKNSTLKTSYESFIKGIETKRKEYLSNLEKLQISLVQKRDLKSAKFVKKYIDDIKIHESSLTFTEKLLVGYSLKIVDTSDHTDILTLKNNSVAEWVRDGKKKSNAQWKILDANKRTIEINFPPPVPENIRKHLMIISQDMKKFEGIRNDGFECSGTLKK